MNNVYTLLLAPRPEGARRRAGICFVAAPRRCTLTSPASRRLASARPALAPKCKRYSLTGPYHQKWNPATEAASAERPGVPGIYRTRQNFAPSLSLIPFRDLKLSVGTSFQRFQTQYPVAHTQTAYAGTADAQYDHDAEGKNGFRQHIRSSYRLRTATRVLESDFVYTRHSFSADYSISKGKNLFGAHFQAGLITGRAPLFERFSLGNSSTLRGWNKFDVAPLGGSRAAHGSLEYRYGELQVFYDVGTVWDPRQSPRVRHSLGVGWVFKNQAFLSLAFPIRFNHVAPVLMRGFRF